MSPGPWADLSPSARRVALDVLIHGPLSRTELARRLELSTASLTRLTRPLLDSGILLELPEPGASQGGRPVQPLDIDAGLQHFVGIKLTAEAAYGVRTNLRADLLDSATVVLGATDPANVVDDLHGLVRDLCGGDAPAAVGVAVGGSVHDFRTVVRAPFLGWRGVDLGGSLAALTGCPATVANDLAALVEVEHWFGDGRHTRNFAVLTVGASVGGGLVVHDQLVTSGDAGLGLLGHFPIDPLGPPCGEGHRGCAHSLMSIDGIQSQVALATGEHAPYDEILRRARDGEPVAARVVYGAARAFGTLIAAVANIALPELVILTGEGIGLVDVAWESLEQAVVAGRNREATKVDVRVVADEPGLWARGAAAVAIQRTVLGTA